MRFHKIVLWHALFAALGLSGVSPACAQQLRKTSGSRAEEALSLAASNGQFTFVVFYKTDGPAAQAMVGALEKGIAAKPDEATLVFVQITSPAEKKLVDKFGVSRAPMPLCLAVAPNGAVTGAFRKAPSADDVVRAFVTPTMTRCMKAMQEGKVVLVCLQNTQPAPTPAGVAGLQADPHFKDRIATVSLATDDPAEADFLAQLQIDADNSEGIATVMLAPPGVLVGKFSPSTTADEMAAALHEAGKCCNDENCKHHKKAGSAQHKTTRNRSNTSRR